MVGLGVILDAQDRPAGEFLVPLPTLNRHALVIEHQYHPLFAFFGAAIVPTGLYATERDFNGYEPGEALAAKIGQAAAEAASRLPSPSSRVPSR